MACALTTGRILDCKNQVGGIKEVFFADWRILQDSLTYDGGGQVTDFDAATLYRYELKSSANVFTQDISASSDTQSVFFTQTLTIQLADLLPTYRVELGNMVRNRRLIIFVRDMNDKIHMMGLDQGAEVTAGSITAGGAKGDFVGHTLTFTAECIAQAAFVEPFTDVPFDNIVNATVSPAY
jgi:hypothetical protein